MREKYTRKVTKEVDEAYGLKITCDICGKVICDFNATPPEGCSCEGVTYFTLTTGHYDWGNDSCDSVEHEDICSEDCVKTALIRYFKGTQQSNTAYFELSKARARKCQDWRTGEIFYREE